MELLYLLLVGAVAGFLAGAVMRVKGGFVVTTILGVIGGYVGSWGAGLLNIAYGGLLGSIAVSALGAIAVVWLYRLVLR